MDNITKKENKLWLPAAQGMGSVRCFACTTICLVIHFLGAATHGQRCT
jgi:hypothetical protein